MILVLNCGSQSIGWKVFKKDLSLSKEGDVRVSHPDNYKENLEKIIEEVKDNFKEIEAVGHRVVHGGEEFERATVMDQEKLEKLKKYNEWAPLHNPFNILGIKIAQENFKEAKQIAVFDTEFYSTLPEKAYTYPLPEKLREDFSFKKFGFHGISHEYTAKEGAKKEGLNFEDSKIISCHLGGGCSITAIKNGKAVDTSMGFTPLEGIIMMTRSGDIDPGIVIKLSKEYGAEKAEEILNKESGMKGLTGSGDMLEILDKIKKGNEKAKKGLEIFVNRIKKYIGSYYAILNGCDLIFFTGSIGAGSEKIRKMITKDLPFNNEFKVVPIEPNEELAIAKKVKKLI